MSHPKHRSGWPIGVLRILLTVLLCGILIVAVGLLTLSLFSDVDWIKRNLLVMVENFAGGPVHIDHVEVNFLPSPQIILEGFAFTSKPPDLRLSLQIRQAEVAFAWNSLWQRNLVLTQAVLQDPELTLYFPLPEKPEEPEPLTFPSIQTLSIHNGRLHLVKPADTGIPSTLTWEHIHFTVAGGQPEGPTNIRLTAQPPDPNPSSSVALQGLLTFMERNPSAPEETLEKDLSPFSLQGQVNMTNLNLNPLMAFFSEEFKHTPPVLMNLQSEYAFTLATGIATLAFPGFQISLNNWKISGKGRIVDLQTDAPIFGFSGLTEAITLERLTGLLPPAWMPAEAQAFLAERQVTGKLQLVSGSVQGSWDQPGTLEAKGTIQVEEGNFLTAPGHPPITQISGTVSWDAPVITIRNLHGSVEPFTVTAPQTLFQLGEAGIEVSLPAFQISANNWAVTGEADYMQVKNAPSTLALSVSAPPVSIQHLARMLPKAWMPAQVRTVLVDREVEGTIELVTGSLKWRLDGDEPIAAEGVIQLTQGQVLVDPDHPPISQLSGSVAFNSSLLRMFDVQGRMYSSDIFIKEATLEWKDSQMWGDIQGGGDILAQDIFQALLRDTPSQKLTQTAAGYRDIQGRIQLATHLRGPLLDPEQIEILQGQAVIDRVNLYPKDDWLSVTGLSGLMSFNQSRLSVKNLNGQIGHSPVQLTGQWNFRNARRSSKLLVNSNLAASDLVGLFPTLSETFSTFAGTLNTTISLSGTFPSPSYRLHIDLTDLALASSGFITKPANIPGTFDATGYLRDDLFVMKQAQLSLPPYRLDAKGSLAMQDPPAVKLGVRTESGTGSLLPKGVILGDERLGLSTLGIALVLEGQDWDRTSWTIQGTVESTDRLRKTDTSGSKPGSKRLRLTWNQRNERANADLSLRNLLIETLMPFDPTPRFTGSLTLTTSMKMNLEPSEWEQRLTAGNGEIHLKDGRILTSPVLSKILGLLNVPNVLLGKINLLKSGFPVDRLTSTFSVENGILSTKNLALKSPVMALAAAGIYDIPEDTFDAIVTVSPFGAYSSLLKSIPLFGTVFEGERKGLTTALFKVEGPRTDPQVTYLPLQSVTGGILGLAQFPLDVLKNVLSLPIQEGEKLLKNNSNGRPATK